VGDLPSRLKAELGVEVWRVIRFRPEGVPVDLRSEWSDVDGLLLDTLVAGASGGTGTPFDWASASMHVRDRAAGQRLIVAGGLRPENVRLAIDRLGPDVVDVSSGVESAPGVKDHRRMAAFMSAVRQDAPSSVS
jgi:phosphoribosylanthranilate isomerase